MAYALATRLERAVKNAGVKYNKASGWASHGRGTMGTVQTIVCHHTAGPKSGNSPSLNVVRNGRPGLNGPLAQLFLARDGTVTIVGAGIANHAGVVRQASYGNSHAIGIEAENTGLSNDPWPKTQIDAYAKLCKALCKEFGLSTSRVLGHKEVCSPPGRKPDPSFNMNDFRSKVNGSKGGVSQGGGTSGGGSTKKYSVVSATAPLGLYDKDGAGRTRVKDWQTDALGYTGKKADGFFGPDSRDDTKALQRQIGLTGGDVDGLVGDTTVKAWKKAGKPKLKKSSGSKPAASKGSPFPLPKGHFYYTEDRRNTVHSGYYEKDRPAIRKIQKAVGTGVDGGYGVNTKSAVARWQKKHGLKPDGAVGADTWAKLF